MLAINFQELKPVAAERKVCGSTTNSSFIEQTFTFCRNKQRKVYVISEFLETLKKYHPRQWGLVE